MSSPASLATRRPGETEHEREDVVRLGRQLANAVGFRVVALDGRDVGELDHVRYQRHADHPDELVIRRRALLRERLAAVKFGEVSAVDPDRGRVYLAIPSEALKRTR